jgi:hypothetical protein
LTSVNRGVIDICTKYGVLEMSPEKRQETTKPQIEEQTRVGLFESIRNAAQNRLAIAGIGLIAALGANEIANTQGEAVASSPGATASGLKEDCVRVGLAKPGIEKAQILGPKQSPDGSKMRIISARLIYEEMPGECRGKYGRTSRSFVEIQNPQKRQKWAKATIAPYYKKDEAGTTGILEGISSSGGVYYKCTPGSRKTGARLVVKNKVIEKGTNKLTRTKIYRPQIKVVKPC